MRVINRFTYTKHSSQFIATVVFFCLTQLSGCVAIKKSTPSHRDGPPLQDIDVSGIKDAVPRVEPYHPYGTRDYVVNGKKYRVLKSSKGYVKTGYASWYGSKFHGRHTSTQERFNLYAMTAASTELPLPSYVEVVNLHNGKKIVVRVNDRGPFYGNRILDLSYAAAKKLGFAEEGVAPVKITAIDPKNWQMNGKTNVALSGSNQNSTRSSNSTQENRLFLQLGAFSNEKNAQTLAHRIRTIVGHDHRVTVLCRSNVYKLQLGPFVTLEDGKKLKELLETKGFTDLIFIR